MKVTKTKVVLTNKMDLNLNTAQQKVLMLEIHSHHADPLKENSS